jgi:FG-GAP-like repeat
MSKQSLFRSFLLCISSLVCNARIAGGDYNKTHRVGIGLASIVFASLECFTSLYTSSVQAQSLPTVQTMAATNIGYVNAVIRGTVNPNGTDTGAWFRYGQTSNYGSDTPTINISGTNIGDVTVSNSLSGLKVGTLYHYQCVATNSQGTNYGADQTFTTLVLYPYTTDIIVTNHTFGSASLVTSVLPNGGDTMVWIAYGPTTSYGNSTPATFVSGTNTSYIAVSNYITGLSPTTIYHYLLVATNSAGSNSDYDHWLNPPIFSSGVEVAFVHDFPNSDLTVGDFNNDGSPDILLEGYERYGVLGIPSNLPMFGNCQITRADFNNDGYLDVFLAGSTNYGGGGPLVTQFYLNLGNGAFTNVPSFSGGIIPKVFGDFNNDGKLDIIGANGLRFNLGNGQFDTNSVALPSGICAVGDFDKDGLLDIVTTSAVWRNLGNGTFALLKSLTTGIASTYFMTTGDFDNDGWPDIAVTGLSSSNTPLCEIWRNLQNGSFSRYASLPGINSRIVLGDFDNDGRLDILAPNQASSAATTPAQIWHNQGNGNFELSSVPVYGDTGLAEWGDLNNDGRLDLLLAGHYLYYSTTNLNIYTVNYCRKYINNFPATNTPPTVPTGLKAQPTSPQSVRLIWNPSTDVQTPSPGLSYNIRVGTTPGGIDIVSPMADVVTGYRRVTQSGNAQQCLFAIVTNLPPGTYYWSVQAIDTGWMGSPFATEGKFTTTPSIGSSTYGSDGRFHISFNSFAGSSYTLKVSTNLVDWSVITNAVAGVNGSYELIDGSSINSPKRFYRLSCP